MDSVKKLIEGAFFHSWQRTAMVLGGLTLAIALPITIVLTQQQQDLRQRASETKGYGENCSLVDANFNPIDECAGSLICFTPQKPALQASICMEPPADGSIPNDSYCNDSKQCQSNNCYFATGVVGVSMCKPFDYNPNPTSPTQPGSIANGNPCTQSSDCQSGYCVSAVDNKPEYALCQPNPNGDSTGVNTGINNPDLQNTATNCSQCLSQGKSYLCTTTTTGRRRTTTSTACSTTNTGSCTLCEGTPIPTPTPTTCPQGNANCVGGQSSTPTPTPTTCPIGRNCTGGQQPTPTPTTCPNGNPNCPAAPTPTNTLAPTATRTPTPTPNFTPTPTPTTTTPVSGGTGSTLVALSVSLPAIGSNAPVAGQGQSSNNETPQRTTRSGEIRLENSSGSDVTSSVTGDSEGIPITLTFYPATFTYKGQAGLGNINTSQYKVKIRLDNSLYTAAAGFPTITKGQTTTISNIKLVTGDVDRSGSGNNELNLNDYIMIKACYNDAAICTPDIKSKADLDDNGIVDILDLQIITVGFATRSGA